MHRQADPNRPCRTIRNTTAVAAGLLVALRVADLAGAITLATVEGFAVLTGFLACGIAAAWCGYRIKARRLEAAKAAAERRAKYAEWEAARLRRQETLLDGDEDRALWDSIPALGSEHDTCAFGKDVIVLAQRRHEWGQQAG